MKKIAWWFLLTSFAFTQTFAQTYPFQYGQKLGAAALNQALANAHITSGTIAGATITNSPITGNTGVFTTLASPAALLSGGTIDNVIIGANTPVAGYFSSVAATTLSASSSVSGVGFSNYWANPPVLGASAPNIVNGSVFNGPGTGLTGTASSLSVGSAVSATNVAGGTAGAIPYQSGVGATGFISPGTATYILTSNGAGVAPTFQSAGLVYNPAAVAITGGTINNISTLMVPNGVAFMSKDSGGTPRSLMYIDSNNYVDIVSAGNLGFRLLGQTGAGTSFSVSDSGNVSAGAYLMNGKVLYSTGTPTIASGFLSSPSITPLQGTSAFIINVGATGATNVGSINMNATTPPPTGWACQFTPWNVTQIATNYIIMTSTTTTISLTQYNNAQAAFNFVGNGQILAHCLGY